MIIIILKKQLVDNLLSKGYLLFDICLDLWKRG